MDDMGGFRWTPEREADIESCVVEISLAERNNQPIDNSFFQSIISGSSGIHSADPEPIYSRYRAAPHAIHFGEHPKQALLASQLRRVSRNTANISGLGGLEVVFHPMQGSYIWGGTQLTSEYRE
nr:hypothetical protein Iba_chr04fCG12790 [Ipomoea batatas]